jgi:aspartate/methionine/tyrosine aminotransferase
MLAVRNGVFHTLESRENELSARSRRARAGKLPVAMTHAEPTSFVDGRPARWSEAPAPDLHFPYMAWAHTHANRTRFPLSSSGMPTADASFLESLGKPDLEHCSKAALPALEEAIARRFGIERSRVIVALGASGGMHLAALRWFRPGTRVVADVPSYEPFRSLPRFFGADLRVLERRPEDGWRIDPAAVRAQLARGAGPGHVFIANPHNPTGILQTRDEVAAIARETQRAGGLLISCDIYMEYVPENRRAWAFECAPNTVTIGSLTKAYGLGSLRIGWIVLGAEVERERAHVVDMAYLAYVDPPTATLRAGALAMARLDELREPLTQVEHRSRPIWARWLASTRGVEAVVPEHGIIAFPRIAGVADTFALAEHLAREHDVDAVPGEFFGLPGHLRVGCGLPPERLTEALARLERGIRSFTRA